MKIGIPMEIRPDETRVAASPDSVKKLRNLGATVAVETGAGLNAGIRDSVYEEAGAEIGSAGDVIADAEVVFKVQRPTVDELKCFSPGQILVAMLNPLIERQDAAAVARAGLTAFAMELLPRITRAQSMDVLSSQANLAGYKAVLDGCAVFGRAMPMMMTAAGTIAPARVLVMGAGVAGLQAIATARRLGAIVSATDVRPAAREQVESLGASFVMVEDEESAKAETESGYAREMSAEYQRKQVALIAETVPKHDMIVCTAQIPGRPAPCLLNEAMVRSMKPGSVIVDLAVESGGNCALSLAGEVADVDGVRIVAHRNVPGRLPVDASSLYARNLVNFITPFIDEDSGDLNIDWQDELIQGTLISRDGGIVHPALLANTEGT